MQYCADASQKLTCPVVTAVVPELNDAVRVTTLPFEVIAMVVVVAAFV
jgi:hypothetical protein